MPLGLCMDKTAGDIAEVFLGAGSGAGDHLGFYLLRQQLPNPVLRDRRPRDPPRPVSPAGRSAATSEVKPDLGVTSNCPSISRSTLWASWPA